MKAVSLPIPLFLVFALTACSAINHQNFIWDNHQKSVIITTDPPDNIIHLKSIGSEIEVKIDGDIAVLTLGGVRKVWCSFLDSSGQELASEYIDVLPAENHVTQYENGDLDTFKIKLENGLHGPILTYKADPYTARIVEIGRPYKIIIHVEYWKRRNFLFEKVATINVAT